MTYLPHMIRPRPQPSPSYFFQIKTYNKHSGILVATRFYVDFYSYSLKSVILAHAPYASRQATFLNFKIYLPILGPQKIFEWQNSFLYSLTPIFFIIFEFIFIIFEKNFISQKTLGGNSRKEFGGQLRHRERRVRVGEGGPVEQDLPSPIPARSKRGMNGGGQHQVGAGGKGGKGMCTG